MKLVNCTPHGVDICFDDKIVNIPPSGIVPRLEEVVEHVKTVRFDCLPHDIDIVMKGFGEVSNLPEPQEGVYYIVSSIVATAVRRPDLLIVDDMVRDKKRRIIGAKRLVIPK